MSQETYIQLERVNNWGNYIYIIARREYYDSVIFDEEQVDEKKVSFPTIILQDIDLVWMDGL